MQKLFPFLAILLSFSFTACQRHAELSRVSSNTATVDGTLAQGKFMVKLPSPEYPALSAAYQQGQIAKLFEELLEDTAESGFGSGKTISEADQAYRAYVASHKKVRILPLYQSYNSLVMLANLRVLPEKTGADYATTQYYLQELLSLDLPTEVLAQATKYLSEVQSHISDKSYRNLSNRAIKLCEIRMSEPVTVDKALQDKLRAKIGLSPEKEIDLKAIRTSLERSQTL